MIEIVYTNRNVRPDSVLNPFISLENGEAKELKLIAGDATDYSGHGSRDKQLIETFIEKGLSVSIEDRDASYLIDQLIEIARGG